MARDPRYELLDSEGRTEYFRLSDLMIKNYHPTTKRIFTWTVVLVITVTAIAAVWLSTAPDWREVPVTPFGVIWCAVFFGGLLAAAITDTRAQRDARVAREALLATAEALPAKDDSRGDDYSSHRHYPVTGVYDPRLYYSRGGSETARNMKAWGYDDYETYESNRPD